MEHLPEISKKSQLRRKVWRLWTGFTILIWAVYVLWWEPVLASNEILLHVPTKLTSVGFSAVLSLGLGSLVALFHENRYRLKAVFRPNLGRLIGAFSLMFVTPLVVVNWLPWIAGSMIPYAPLWISVAIIFLGTLFWYPASSLIISGLKSKWRRFGLFCLMFWSAYCAIILLIGVASFSL